jgi:uncharacterized membrane protein YfcA
MDWTIVLLSAGIILTAAMVHAIAGFGFAQVSMGLLPLIRSASSASVVFTFLAIVANTRVWWSVREHFKWKEWVVPLAGLAAGLPIGILFFMEMNEDAIRMAIALVLLIGVVLLATVRLSDRVKRSIEESGYRPGKITGVAVGFIAGMLGGSVAIPGPPMILYGAFMVSAGIWKNEEMKAIFTAFFGSLMAYRATILIVSGDVTLAYLGEALVLVVPLLFGAWVGLRIFNKVPPEKFRWLVLAMLTINALVLMITSLPE